MIRLIDADALISKAEAEAMGMEEPFRSSFAVTVAWLVEKMPTIESEPILLPTIHIVDGYDTVEDENGNKGFGVYIPDTMEIYVAGDVPREIKLKTLFHELCHWIQDISDREFNEFEAENFSNFMYGVIDMTIDFYKSGEVKTEG